MSRTPWEAFLQTVPHNLPHHTFLLHGDNAASCAYQLAARILQDSSVAEKKWNPDFYENFPSSKGGLHLIDTPRMIQKTLWLEPFSCSYKVYLVHDIDRITLPAIAAFLKILEEPPSHSAFILTSTNKQHLPATILSRCFVLYVGQTIEQVSLSKEVGLLLNLLLLLENHTCSIQGGQDCLIQIEHIIHTELKEYNRVALQSMVKTYLDILVKIVRDRFILDNHLQLVPFFKLSFPEFEKKILLVQTYPVHHVINIVEHAMQALDNMTPPLSCLQWVFLQLLSLKNQSQKT